VHEAQYSQAVLPSPARVLGLNLRPYSLGHELWLIREQNPLAVSIEAGAAAMAASLPAAALICSQTFREIVGMNRDRLIAFKLRLWHIRLKRANFGRELSAFLDYRNKGTLAFPDESPDGNGGRSFGAPLLLSMHQFLRRQMSDADAWDYPYGRAQMEYAAWLESEGRLKIKNRFEIEHDRSFAEWEKQNPGSTLEVMNA
jgi:hypothetical protein